ncbi:MAG: NUDIX hydrolase [Bacteroidetes bacterium]|nr:NUDIX hydrolase [Bacteroidota bacterium]
MERADSVCAVVFNKETDKYLFVKQFRVGAKKEMIELVAGMVEKDDVSLEDCIIREIAEELGYSVNKDDVRFLYSFYSSPEQVLKRCIYSMWMSTKKFLPVEEFMTKI